MHESEKWKWTRSVMTNSFQPHGLQPTRLLCPWDFPGKSTGVGCHCPNLGLFPWNWLPEEKFLGQKAGHYLSFWCVLPDCFPKERFLASHFSTRNTEVPIAHTNISYKWFLLLFCTSLTTFKVENIPCSLCFVCLLWPFIGFLVINFVYSLHNRNTNPLSLKHFLSWKFAFYC